MLVAAPAALSEVTADAWWDGAGCTTGTDSCNAVANGHHTATLASPPADGFLDVEGGQEDTCYIDASGGVCNTHGGTHTIDEGQCKTTTATTDPEIGEPVSDEAKACVNEEGGTLQLDIQD